MSRSPVDPPEWGFEAETEPAIDVHEPIVAFQESPPRRNRAVLAIALLGLLLIGAVGAISLLGADGGSNLSLESVEVATPLPEIDSEPSTLDSDAGKPSEGLETTSSEENGDAVPLPRVGADDANTEASLSPAPSTSVEPAPSSTSSSTTPATTSSSVTPTSESDEAPTLPTPAEPPPEGTTQVAYANDNAMMIFEEPDQRVGWALPNPTQFGGPRVVAVLGTSPDQLWHKVSVPVQPNGSVGWVKADSVRIEEHNYRARITLSNRRVQVWDGDTVVTDTGAVIGKSSTPTPLGTFFVRDIIPQSYTGGAYGPWILALSGFSEVMDSFAGGLPAIAVHGTNRPDLVGSAASNGCIRIPNEVVTQLAATVPLGTQVEIVA